MTPMQILTRATFVTQLRLLDLELQLTQEGGHSVKKPSGWREMPDQWSNIFFGSAHAGAAANHAMAYPAAPAPFPHLPPEWVSGGGKGRGIDAHGVAVSAFPEAMYQVPGHGRPPPSPMTPGAPPLRVQIPTSTPSQPAPLWTAEQSPAVRQSAASSNNVTPNTPSFLSRQPSPVSETPQFAASLMSGVKGALGAIGLGSKEQREEVTLYVM